MRWATVSVKFAFFELVVVLFCYCSMPNKINKKLLCNANNVKRKHNTLYVDLLVRIHLDESLYAD